MSFVDVTSTYPFSLDSRNCVDSILLLRLLDIQNPTTVAAAVELELLPNAIQLIRINVILCNLYNLFI